MSSNFRPKHMMAIQTVMEMTFPMEREALLKKVYQPSHQQRKPWTLRPFVASPCHRGVELHLKFGLSFTLMCFSLREPSVPTTNSLSSPDVDHTSFLCNWDDCQESNVQATISLAVLAVLPPGEMYVPFPPWLGENSSSYYSCPRRMLEHDPIYPTPGFDSKTQKQVLHTIWKPRMGTFQYIVDTMPQETPEWSKVQQRMWYSLEEIVDDDGWCL